jgi:hypothetical protein
MRAFASVGSVVLLPTRTASDNAPSKRTGVANGLDGHENKMRTHAARVKPSYRIFAPKTLGDAPAEIHPVTESELCPAFTNLT